jgi:hypothetical protein
VTAIPPPTDTAIPTPTGATTTSSLPTPTGSGKSGTKQKHKKRDATSQDGPNPSARGRQPGAGMQAVPRVRIVEA